MSLSLSSSFSKLHLLLLLLVFIISAAAAVPVDIDEIVALHRFYYNHEGRPVWCDPLGEVVFHADSEAQGQGAKTIAKGYYIFPNASNVDWSVTVTEFHYSNERYRCLYTNMILEAAVRCQKNEEVGCTRLDPPTHCPYIDSILAATLLGLGFIPKGSQKHSQIHQSCDVRILLGGLGSGMIPMFFGSLAPWICMDVIELLPGVIEATTGDLGLNLHNFEGNNIRIVESDFVTFVESAASQYYDAVVVDISGNDGDGGRMLPPKRLSSPEFIKELWRILKDDHGFYVQHYWNTGYSQQQLKTSLQQVQAVFNNFAVHLNAGSSWITNARKTTNPRNLTKMEAIELATKIQRELDIASDKIAFVDIVKQEWSEAPKFTT